MALKLEKRWPCLSRGRTVLFVLLAPLLTDNLLLGPRSAPYKHTCAHAAPPSLGPHHQLAHSHAAPPSFAIQTVRFRIHVTWPRIRREGTTRWVVFRQEHRYRFLARMRRHLSVEPRRQSSTAHACVICCDVFRSLPASRNNTRKNHRIVCDFRCVIRDETTPASGLHASAGPLRPPAPQGGC